VGEDDFGYQRLKKARIPGGKRGNHQVKKSRYGLDAAGTLDFGGHLIRIGAPERDKEGFLGRLQNAPSALSDADLNHRPKFPIISTIVFSGGRTKLLMTRITKSSSPVFTTWRVTSAGITFYHPRRCLDSANNAPHWNWRVGCGIWDHVSRVT